MSFSRLLSDTFIELINLSSLFVTGLKRPYLSASLGALWLAGRIFYTIGYSSGDPKRRLTRGGYLSSAALIGQYPSVLVDISLRGFSLYKLMSLSFVIRLDTYKYIYGV